MIKRSWLQIGDPRGDKSRPHFYSRPAPDPVSVLFPAFPDTNLASKHPRCTSGSLRNMTGTHFETRERENEGHFTSDLWSRLSLFINLGSLALNTPAPRSFHCPEPWQGDVFRFAQPSHAYRKRRKSFDNKKKLLAITLITSYRVHFGIVSKGRRRSTKWSL
jgi:hypothetical protein